MTTEQMLRTPGLAPKLYGLVDDVALAHKKASDEYLALARLCGAERASCDADALLRATREALVRLQSFAARCIGQIDSAGAVDSWLLKED